MIRLSEDTLLQLIAELPLSQFKEACKKAGITEEEMQHIADLISARGE